MPSENKVLIVDDEEFLREALCEEFQLAGFKPLGAANAKIAIELVKQHTFDAMISDMRMPGGNGDELLDYVRSVNVETPAILFLTGYSDLSEEDLYDRGAAKIFSKPFDLPKVIKSVQDLSKCRSERWLKISEEKPEIRVELNAPDVLRLGQGGMFLCASHSLVSVGEFISFSVAFGPQRIEGSGHVRWARSDAANLKGGMGIEFYTLTPSSFEIVTDYLDQHQPKAYIPKN